MRLIDADALLEQLGKRAEMHEDDECTELTIHEDMYEVKNAPTIEAIPVVHGRWDAIFEKLWNVEFEVVTGFECSNCGHLEGFELNYCPNCGAKMDGEADVQGTN